MEKGNDLKKDLKLLINNPKYSDIEILCKDEKKFYGCKAILAARSDVFDRLLYNGMKESFEKQISFPTIDSSEMEIILTYIYTGLIKKESLTKDNIIEVFYAADYFQLLKLQNTIMETIKTGYVENYSPELLSKAVEIMPLVEDNSLLNLFVEKVAIMSLNTIEFDRFSIAGLQLLLSCTYEKEKIFTTPEYEVFRYSAILAANQVSNDAYETLKKHLPTLEQLEDERLKGPIRVVENKFIITDHQEVVKELEPLIEFIDFRRIESKILDDIIKPLEIIPTEIVSDVYQYKALSKKIENTRGISHYTWDELACGSNVIIGDDGKVVRAQVSRNRNRVQENRWPYRRNWNENHVKDDDTHRNVSAKKAIPSKGIFEWDVIIEKYCNYSWVGVRGDNFNHESFAGAQSTGWVLGDGYCYNSSKYINNYCPPFKEGTKITVHLDMNKRSCAFSVDGKRYPEVSTWNNLPSKLYPVVSLKYPGRFRIQPHYRE